MIALDDTLIRRLGEKLGLVWTWWNGMTRRVGRGQNVIALVLVVGDRVFPLDVRIASKQGRCKLTKPVLAERMLRDWEVQWAQRDLSPQQVKLVADSWYTSQDLLALCRELKLEAITEGKASYSFTVEGKKIKAAERSTELTPKSEGRALDRSAELTTKPPPGGSPGPPGACGPAIPASGRWCWWASPKGPNAGMC